MSSYQAECDALTFGSPPSMRNGLCQCVICSRCGHHTGNSGQGHYWAYCKVTHETREFHFCCPDLAYGCELETAKPCGDCAVPAGTAHEQGCDVARCLVTGMQRIACSRRHDCGADVWTGTWPGDAECREFGWFALFSADDGWERCSADEPGAMPDLNRLVCEARWDPAAQRWVK